MSMPYSKIKNEKVVEIRLDGQDYKLEVGKHLNKL
jgi:hypothetical protein